MTAWPPIASTSRVLHAGECTRVGTFRCPPGHPDFRAQGAGETGFELVFPASAVWIRREGAAPFVADPATVIVFNPRTSFERGALDPSGAREHWFQVDQATALEAAARAGARAVRTDAPFPIDHAAADPRLFLQQWRLCRRLERGDPIEPFEIAETVTAILEDALRSGCPHVGGDDRGEGRAVPSPAARLVVTRARRVLAERFRDTVTLAEIAAEVKASKFYLVRVFRLVTGITMHTWLTRLRIHTALTELPDASDLSALAHSLGFSSHSHFTAAFRRYVGCTPSAARSFCGRDPGALRSRAAQQS